MIDIGQTFILLYRHLLRKSRLKPWAAFLPVGRGPVLHAAAQASAPAAAQHEDCQDDGQLLQCGVQGGGRDLPRTQ